MYDPLDNKTPYVCISVRKCKKYNTSQAELATATIINVSWVIDFLIQEYKIASIFYKTFFTFLKEDFALFCILGQLFFFKPRLAGSQNR